MSTEIQGPPPPPGARSLPIGVVKSLSCPEKNEPPLAEVIALSAHYVVIACPLLRR